MQKMGREIEVHKTAGNSTDDSSYISARMQIRRTIQYYEQNWESTHLKQEETLEG